MDLYSLAEGPLLWFAFFVFTVGIGLRIAFFLNALVRGSRNTNVTWEYIAASVARACVPFYRAVVRKPIYVTLRYVFHISLIVVPIWLAGHIALWEESRFEWSWAALPDVWADWMTLLVLGIAAYFLIRRIFLPEIRNDSSLSDYILIVMTALPFLTGYLLTQGSLDSIPFFEYYMETFHILSAEVMFIGIVCLFYKTRLDVDKCTGCAACEITCPTGTLLSRDEGKFRIFSYLHYQCICCGACVRICPEEAASLRHELKPVRFFQIFFRREIRSVALSVCKGCGALFAPEPQMNEVSQLIPAEFTHNCPKCRINDCVSIIKPSRRLVHFRRGRKSRLE